MDVEYDGAGLTFEPQSPASSLESVGDGIESGRETETATVEQVLERCGGFGRLQWQLLWVNGLLFLALGVNMLFPTILKAHVMEVFEVSQIKADLTVSVFFFGYTIAMPVWGALNDSRGRRPICIVGCAIMAVSSSAMFLCRQYELFLLFRAIAGVGTSAAFNAALVLMFELSDSVHRPRCKAWVSVCWSSSHAFLALSDYLVRNTLWRFLGLTQLISFFALFLLARTLPESPRFYLVGGRPKRAVLQIVDIARINRVAPPFDPGAALAEPHRFLKLTGNTHRSDPNRSGEDTELSEPQELPVDRTLSAEDSGRHGARAHSTAGSALGAMRQLLSQEVLRATICIGIAHFVATTSYYAIAFSTEIGGGVANPYVRQALSAAVEIPMHITMPFLANQLGRRATLTLFFVVVSVTGFVIEFAKLSGALTESFALISRMAALGSSGLMYVFAAESFPTSCRNTGVNWGSLCGHAGAVVAPVLMDAVPRGLAFIAVACALACVSLLMLPETEGEELCDAPSS